MNAVNEWTKMTMLERTDEVVFVCDFSLRYPNFLVFEVEMFQNLKQARRTFY